MHVVRRNGPLALVDDLEREVNSCGTELHRLGADHPDVPLLMTVPSMAWVLGYTIASEIGDIRRFGSRKKLAGYTGLCPMVHQSGRRDDRGPLAKNGPSTCAGRSSRRPPTLPGTPSIGTAMSGPWRLGKQRGAKVARVELARVELARELASAIWHMLTKRQPFAPGRPHVGPLVA